MDNQVQEREISILDLFYFIIKEWRKLIIVATIGMLIFAMLFAYKNRSIIFNKNNNQAVVSNGTDIVVSTDDYDTTITTMQNAINNYMNLLIGCKNYQENSMMMKFDAFNVPEKIISFTIDNVQDDKASVKNSIINSYVNVYFPTKIDWEKISEITGLDKVYLDEIIVIDTLNNIPNNNNNGSANYNSYRITIKHTDKDVINKVASELKNQMASFRNEISAKTALHEITIKESNINEVYDYAVLNKQAEISNKIRDYTNCITDVKTKFEKYKKENSGTVVSAKLTLTKKKLIKYLIIGAFLGCFIIAFWYFCVYIFKGLLHTDDELKCMYGIEHFGTISCNKDDKLNPIDKLIKKLFKSNIYNEPEEEALKRISVFINNAEPKHITFIGAGDEDVAKNYVKKLKKYVDNKNLEFIGNPVKSAEVVKELSKCDGIVLIEELEKSKVSDINLEYSSIKSLSKNVLGYIICA